MLTRKILRLVANQMFAIRQQSSRYLSSSSNEGGRRRDEEILRNELNLTGIYLEEIDSILDSDKPSNYPNLQVHPSHMGKPMQGHNVMVIQPWTTHSPLIGITYPDLQLDECVSLGNTIHNWKVVAKELIVTHKTNHRFIFGPKIFEDLKERILSRRDITSVLFGVELLSGVQLASLENELKMPVYDRFTVVLNIFRQHAKTKEARLQLALAEIPYIRQHLREIHETSDRVSSTDHLKDLIGGVGDRFYRRRVQILKQRESKLKSHLSELKRQRLVTGKSRKVSNMPIVSIVGYTNSGKTSLIKYLTEDPRLIPEDQLFATLDVSSHKGQLPSIKDVLYVDTVGFISRVPTLLVDAFSATLEEVVESNLILHVLDISHPDHKLQSSTVTAALKALKVPKKLLTTKITIGNKLDLLQERDPVNGDMSPPPTCDLRISVKKNTNLDELVALLDERLNQNVNTEVCTIRVENGGERYHWLRKNATITDCKPDPDDANKLICKVTMLPAIVGRFQKFYGTADVLSNIEAFKKLGAKNDYLDETSVEFDEGSDASHRKL